jgi:hypothetical protein
MNDLKISQLNAAGYALLSDYVPMIRFTGGVWLNYRVTIAFILVSQNLLQGESGQVSANGATVITFLNSWANYDLIITCSKDLTCDNMIGYDITNRTANGFTITPIESAVVQWTIVGLTQIP